MESMLPLAKPLAWLFGAGGGSLLVLGQALPDFEKYGQLGGVLLVVAMFLAFTVKRDRMSQEAHTANIARVEKIATASDDRQKENLGTVERTAEHMRVVTEAVLRKGGE